MPAVLAMERYELYMLLGELIKVVWVFAFGACIGSLTNVLVYRIPLGLDVVSPPSRCPSCETRLTWRENIPIFGWLLLRGKCRFCRSPVSAEYPIVEAVVALLWVVTYLALYSDGRFLGINFAAIQPEWGRSGFVETWPIFLVVLTLFSCLVAMTLVDAKTFQIPLVLTWVPALAGLIIHPVFALWVQFKSPIGRLAYTAPGYDWAIASPGPHGWLWIGGSIGATAGLVLANLLLAKGVIRRSFLDYDGWEKSALAAAKATVPDATIPPADLAGTIPAQPPAPPTDMWIQYPHARREMFRELIFLAPCIGLGLLGASLAANWAGPWTFSPNLGAAVPALSAPVWLDVSAGVLMGYLIGGGVVWAIRILGSLVFGKEAMGLGDVHMMAAVGACLGWIDPVLAFFGAAFLGVGWFLLSLVFGKGIKRALPFGPFLAVGTMLVWFAKPVIEHLITQLTKAQLPINLP